MNKLTAFTIVALLCSTVVCAAEPDLTANIRASFEDAMEAAVVGDPETIVNGTYPGLVEKVGGRDAMRSMVVRNLKDLEGRGMAVLKTEIVSISEPLQAGDELHSIVRARRTVKAPGGRQIQDTFMIAVSGDAGESWTFVDGPQLKPSHIQALFPNFNPALELPETSPPTFEKD